MTNTVYALMIRDLAGMGGQVRAKVDSVLAGEVQVEGSMDIPESVITGVPASNEKWGPNPSPEQMERLREQWGKGNVARGGKAAIDEMLRSLPPQGR